MNEALTSGAQSAPDWSDEGMLLDEIARREAERKLAYIPGTILNTAWVRDAQIEAVIDATLAAHYACDPRGYVRARHVGEWSAKIAAAIPFGPDQALARRIGVLSELDPVILGRIVELRHVGPFVSNLQRRSITSASPRRTMLLVVATARAFELQMQAHGHQESAASILRRMMVDADDAMRPLVKGLSIALRLVAAA